MVYVNESLCTGCGECVKVCPTSAIQVVNSLAHIDQALCQGCESCVSACPNKAIFVLQEAEQARQPIIVRDNAPLRTGAPLAAPAPPHTRVWPAVGTALAFVGREIIPRVAWTLLDAWDRRRAIKKDDAHRNVVSSSRPGVAQSGKNSRGGGQRRRWRGGNS